MILDHDRHQKPGQPGRQTEDRCGPVDSLYRQLPDRGSAYLLATLPF